MRAEAKSSSDFETGVTNDDRLDLRIWLRLLTCSNLIETRLRKMLRQEFDTTLPRFDLLSQLDRAPDGLTMGELSRRLMVTNGNVTGLIDRLVGEGLVVREPAPKDRRAHLVRLTKQGSDVFAAMVPAHKDKIRRLFSGLKRAELANLLELLGMLKTSIETKDTKVQTKEKSQ